MKKICIDARMLFYSGIGTYLRNLIKGFENHPKFTLCLLVYAKDKNYPTNHEKILFDAPIYSVKEQFLYPKIIPKCDLFWSPHFNVPLRKIQAKHRIVTIHDTYHLTFLSTFSFLQRLYAKFVYAKAIKLSEKIITVSKFSKSEIIKHLQVDPAKVDAIHLGIDQDLFTPKKTKPLFKNPYLLYVGNLKPNKNLLVLLKAFAKIAEEFPNLELQIVSNGSIKEQESLLFSLNEKNKSILSRIHFHKGITDENLSNFYRYAKAFVFPSFYEGFGFPPLEAMSLGCPVIAAKAASIPEVCGDAAMYFDPHDVNSLISCIKKVLQPKDPSVTWKEMEKNQVLKYPWKKTVEEHEKLFCEILEKTF